MAAATHRSDERLTPRKRALAGLGICLIVPLSAGFGLTVPLPDIVERVAGSLLSGQQLLAFESEVSDDTRRGVWIVLTPDERTAVGGEAPVRDTSGSRAEADETVVVPAGSDGGSSTGSAGAGQEGGSATGEDGRVAEAEPAVAVAAAGSGTEHAALTEQAMPVEDGSTSDPGPGSGGSGGGDQHGGGGGRPETPGAGPGGPGTQPEDPGGRPADPGTPPEEQPGEGTGGGRPDDPGGQGPGGGQPTDPGSQGPVGGRPDDPGSQGPGGGSGSGGGKPGDGKA